MGGYYLQGWQPKGAASASKDNAMVAFGFLCGVIVGSAVVGLAVAASS